LTGNGRAEKRSNCYSEIPKRRDVLGDLGVDWRMILKWILKTQDTDQRQSLVLSIEDDEFLDEVTGC
jgi:hypothetical protein